MAICGNHLFLCVAKFSAEFCGHPTVWKINRNVFAVRRNNTKAVVRGSRRSPVHLSALVNVRAQIPLSWEKREEKPQKFTVVVVDP